MITVTEDRPVMTIKGAKKGQEQPRKPNISKDTVASISTIKILYGLGEGEVEGLVNGANSIFLEGTPLLDSNANSNFDGITWDFRHGTNDQEYIQGFPDVSNETGIGVELTQAQPYIKAYNDTQLSALRVRLKFGRLAQTDSENGDVNGTRIDYAIDLQVDGSPYNEVLLATVEDKASAGYERTHRIDLPQASTGWQIRIRRITPDSDSDLLQNKMSVDAIAEVIDVKLRYPNTALLGLQYNAELFGKVAKLSVLTRGKIIRVPSNYDANTRNYTGIWDGTFVDAYSNNPAWVYYDLCREWRYGLGEKLASNMIDKWSLYQLAQYCDEPVSNGMGGTEPRFTCNVYIQQQADAYQVLQNIAGIFRAMSYWNGEKIIIDADVPQDPVYTFSSANVVEGAFEYTGTRQRDRHTLVKVAWDNPANDFQTEYEYVRDEEALAKFGVKVLDLAAFGCTSQSQAQRAGQWALRTEQLETRQVAFSVGLDGFIPQVGNIVNVNDELFAGRAMGGRVSAVSAAQYVVTVDRDLTTTDGYLVINGSDGVTQKRSIKSIAGRKITLNEPFDTIEPENIWAIETPDLKLIRFRVMSITKNDNETFNIVGIQHEPTKYADIDNSVYIDPSSYPENNIISDNSIDAPSDVTISARYRTDQAVTVTTLVIEWSQVNKAAYYDVEYRKDSGSWVKLPQSSSVGSEVDDIYSGTYTARVRAVSPFGVQSKPTESAPTFIESKVGTPAPLSAFNVQGILFGIHLYWGFGNGSEDTAYTEIEQATAPDQDVSQLGTYAYPTNSVTIQGMPPNLTVYYRARLVDKFDLKGDWTEWKQGQVSADAQAVLDLLNGKITESQLYSDLGNQINQIGSNKTTIEQQEIAIDGLYGQYTVKVDVNGRVSGFGLASSDTASEFAIRADRFYIAPPNGTGIGDAAFIYQSTPYTDPDTGTVIPEGLYLKDAFIKNASVGTLKIAGNAVIIPRAVVLANTALLRDNGEVSIMSATVDAEGGSVSLQFNFSKLSYATWSAVNGTAVFRFYRGTELLKTMTFESNYERDTSGPYTDYRMSHLYSGGLVLDNPPQGDFEYKITAQVYEREGAISLQGASMQLLGIKR